MTTISRNEWLSELEKIMRSRTATVDGLTAAELAAQWGCCQRVVLQRLRMMRDRIISGRKPGVSIDGRPTMVPCYRLSPKAAKRR